MAVVNAPPSKACFFFLIFLAGFFVLFSSASAYEVFRVGGERGWTEPTGRETETYNQWAARNRFHVGDSVYFKYENDSVLVVDHGDYGECNTSDPLLKFGDGNTKFTFDRYGYFYFVSGEPGHCKSGQKLDIRVMVHPEFKSLAPSPIPQQGGGGGGGNWISGSVTGFGPSASPMPNSGIKLRGSLSVVIMALAAIGGLLVMFMFV